MMLSEAMGSEEWNQRVGGWRYVNAYLVDLMVVLRMYDFQFSAIEIRITWERIGLWKSTLAMNNSWGWLLRLPDPDPHVCSSHTVRLKAYPPSGCSPTRIFTHSHPPHQQGIECILKTSMEHHGTTKAQGENKSWWRCILQACASFSPDIYLDHIRWSQMTLPN